MNKETAKWVRKAEADFQVAMFCANLKPSLSLHTCFHCQQSAEKYLQALLVEANSPGPRIHDLEKLHDLVMIQDPSLGAIRKGASILTHFADEDGFQVERATSRQAKSALRWAERVRKEIRQRLKLPPKS